MTAARLLLVVPFVVFTFAGDTLAAGLTALVAILSDIDGTVARHLKATSRFGAFFDPFVDAAFVLTGLFLLASLDRIAWLFVLAYVLAGLAKTAVQTVHFVRSKQMRSNYASKSGAMLGFCAVIAASFALPSWVAHSFLAAGCALYVGVGAWWLR